MCIRDSSRELEHALSEHLTALAGMLSGQHRLQRDSQEAVLRTRMTPVQTIAPRLHRSVRQTCRLTDKQAELTLSGADTLVDSQVLNDMADPLMHILRNAVAVSYTHLDVYKRQVFICKST